MPNSGLVRAALAAVLVGALSLAGLQAVGFGLQALGF